MTTTAPSAEALERTIAILCQMRPDVRREVFEDFMAGRSPQTLYLHIDPREFLLIISAAYRRGVEDLLAATLKETERFISAAGCRNAVREQARALAPPQEGS